MYSIVSIIRLGRLGLLEFEIEIVLVVQIETFLDFHVLRLSKSDLWEKIQTTTFNRTGRLIETIEYVLRSHVPWLNWPVRLFTTCLGYENQSLKPEEPY